MAAADDVYTHCILLPELVGPSCEEGTRHTTHAPQCLVGLVVAWGNGLAGWEGLVVFVSAVPLPSPPPPPFSHGIEVMMFFFSTLVLKNT